MILDVHWTYTLDLTATASDDIFSQQNVVVLGTTGLLKGKEQFKAKC
jgi:hypothetical protein